jgi:hypothetical protein
VAVGDAVGEVAQAGEPVSEGPTPETRERRLRKRIAELKKELARKQVVNLSLTAGLLAAGLGLLWLTKSVLKINGDGIFIALLLVPVIVYLATTDQLSKLSGFGASIEFKQHVDTIKEDVTKHVTQAENELSQLEPRRTALFGKLNQILDTDRFLLIYADVDQLRDETARCYLLQKAPKLGEQGSDPRKTEQEIRRSIIRDLELALLDGFYKTSGKGAKCDIFRLEDPDVAMIVRGVTPGQAEQIAEKALNNFRRPDLSADPSSDRTATCAVFTPPPPGQHRMSPKELDRAAAKALEAAKRSDRGRMHVA